MRIIGGFCGGRVIRVNAKLPVRPTTDLAKESLFNILGNHKEFDGLKVLDLFSGTGNITYEFASRGAALVDSVDMNNKCIQFIRATALDFKLTQIQPIQANAFQFLKNARLTYDIIFADPPYESEDIETIPLLVFEKNMLNKGGWLIVEHSKSISFEAHPCFFQARKYGKVNFSIFRMNA